MSDCTCPACGSHNVESVTNSEEVCAPYGIPQTYNRVIDSCLDCYMVGDFNEVSSLEYVKALRRSLKVNISY